MKNLLTKEDIKVGKYITVIRSAKKLINKDTGKITYDQSFQDECLLITAVDLPLIRVEIMDILYSTYTINLDEYVIRLLSDDFVKQVLKDIEK